MGGGLGSRADGGGRLLERGRTWFEPLKVSL